jgi:ATP-dependent helicase/nuclease subunit A
MGSTSDPNRFLRGTLTHALLQHLPGLDPKSWTKAAKAFVAVRGATLSQRAQASIVSETLAVLTHPDFAPLFAPGSQAEVPIVAAIPRPTGRGPALKLTGQIDRLVDTHSSVLIVDYKTNNPPARTPEDIADVYLYQLAAYRLAIAAIYPGRTIRAALLWTASPAIMEISSTLLDAYAERLWTLDVARLDADR